MLNMRFACLREDKINNKIRDHPGLSLVISIVFETKPDSCLCSTLAYKKSRRLASSLVGLTVHPRLLKHGCCHNGMPSS